MGRLPAELSSVVDEPVIEPSNLPAVLDVHTGELVPFIPSDAFGQDLAKANIYAKSGFFNVKSPEEAYSKMMLGRELGLGEVTALKEIYAVSGRMAISAAIMAGLIKKSGIYDYQVKQLDNTVCVIVFLCRGQVVGHSSFSMQEARQAGLENKDNWKKYPRNMLWSRAMANGCRWFLPQLTCGTLYTPDELGSNVVEIIESE